MLIASQLVGYENWSIYPALTAMTTPSVVDHVIVTALPPRADVLLGLAAVNLSGVGPHAAGVIATDGTKIGACLR